MPDKSRRVLVCVTGLTPQVVTETVYALTQRETPWVPDEVHVLTTFSGAKRARLLLGQNGDGELARLCRDYELANIQFSKQNIHVLNGPDGQPLDRKSTRLNSSHVSISYAVFCLKKKKVIHRNIIRRTYTYV